MGLTKSEVFDTWQNQVADYAKAFAHPARVAILEELIRRRKCVCGDLVDVLPLSQSTISQHLKELKRIGLIRGEVEGPRICYCIDDETWRAAQRQLGALFQSYRPSDCC